VEIRVRRRPKKETNYRNTHNLSRNGHNILWIFMVAITRIMRIRFKLMVGKKRITKNEKEWHPTITNNFFSNSWTEFFLILSNSFQSHTKEFLSATLHELSQIKHEFAINNNSWVIRGSFTVIRVRRRQKNLVCDATCNPHVMTHVMFHIIIFMSNSWAIHGNSCYAIGKEETN